MSNLGLLGGKRSRGGVSQTCGACRGQHRAHTCEKARQRGHSSSWRHLGGGMGSASVGGGLGGVGGGLGASAMSLIDGEF